jgi:hypothetical protein
MSKDTKDPAEMIVATYSPHLDTSNIEKVFENWKIALRVKHGPITSFLITEEYPVIKEPEEPILTDVTEGTLKYEAIKKAYLEGVSESVKENRRMTLERPKIAATMLAHISPECLAHCARDGDWRALVDAADDPLGIWLSMSKSMRSRTVGDTLRARKSVCQAYSRHIMKEGQSLAAYTKEREHLLASMKALGVPDKDQDELVMDYIDGLHRGRYSTLQIHVQNDRDKMPKTMHEAYEKVAGWVVSVTRRAESYVSERVDKNKNKDKKGSPSPKRDMSKVKCFNCLEMGHLARSCPNAKKTDDDEEANVGMPPELVGSDSETELEDAFICYKVKSSKGKLKAVLETAHKVGSGRQLHSNEIGLDSMCSANLFGNRKLLKNIRPCSPIRFKGIRGTETATEVGDHPSFGKCYLRPRSKNSAKVNLLSLGVLQTVKGFKIEYRQKTGSFIVKGLDKVSYEFSLSSGNLFVCDLPDCLDDTAMWNDACYHVETDDAVESDHTPNRALVTTVSKNEALYTKREVETARRVRESSTSMGDLSQGMLHSIVTTRRVHGIDFNRDDVNRAEAIYGRDLQVPRGKSARRSTKKAVPRGGKIVSPKCVFRTGVINSRSAAEVTRAVDRQVATAHSEGFKAVEVCADSEGAIGAMAVKPGRAGRKRFIRGKSNDSTDIDAKIRQVNVVKSISALPYLLAMAMISFAVYFVVFELNTLSIVAKANTMAFKRPALLFGPKGDSLGTAWFYNLVSETAAPSNQWKPLPMDGSTISRVNEIARQSPPLPKKIPMYYKGREVSDKYGDEEQADALPRRTVRFVVDSRHDAPDPTFANESLLRSSAIDIINADDVLPNDDTGRDGPEPMFAAKSLPKSDTVQYEPDDLLPDSESETDGQESWRDVEAVEIRGDEPPEEADSRGDEPPEEADSRGDEPPEEADSRGDEPPEEAETRGDEPVERELAISSASEQLDIGGGPGSKQIRGGDLEALSHCSTSNQSNEIAISRDSKVQQRRSPYALIASVETAEEVYQAVEAAFGVRDPPVTICRPYGSSIGKRSKCTTSVGSSSSRSVRLMIKRGALRERVEGDRERVRALEKPERSRALYDTGSTPVHLKAAREAMIDKLRNSRAPDRRKLKFKWIVEGNSALENLKARSVARGQVDWEARCSDEETASPTWGLQLAHGCTDVDECSTNLSEDASETYGIELATGDSWMALMNQPLSTYSGSKVKPSMGVYASGSSDLIEAEPSRSIAATVSGVQEQTVKVKARRFRSKRVIVVSPLDAAVSEMIDGDAMEPTYLERYPLLGFLVAGETEADARASALGAEHEDMSSDAGLVGAGVPVVHELLDQQGPAVKSRASSAARDAICPFSWVEELLEHEGGRPQPVCTQRDDRSTEMSIRESWSALSTIEHVAMRVSVSDRGDRVMIEEVYSPAASVGSSVEDERLRGELLLEMTEEFDGVELRGDAGEMEEIDEREGGGEPERAGDDAAPRGAQKVGVLQCVGEQRSVGAVCIAPVQDIERGDDQLVTDGVIRLV